MRLSKFLAAAGIASRRRSEELIFRGFVKVNGRVADTPAIRVDPDQDEVTVCGRKVPKPDSYRYILLYKPSGYLSTVEDPWGRPTVMDLIKEVDRRVYPIGRLDLDTEGVLLLTNDGKLAYRLTHPRFEVKKVYRVKVRGVPSPKTLGNIRKGVYLEDGRTAPARVRMVAKQGEFSELEIAIHEGRKRQVKRVFAAVGHPVVRLKRVRFAFLDLKGLRPGEYRYLKASEVDKLRRLVKLA